MARISTDAPIRSEFFDVLKSISRPWQDFFTLISEALFYVGSEGFQALVNNQSTAVDITSLSFDKRYVSAAYVDYLIQRTTSTNESVEAGTFFLSYKHKADAWQISSGPSAAGVTITVTSTGQCQYQTTNQSGTFLDTSLSRIVFRARTIRAKSKLYSVLGNAGAA